MYAINDMQEIPVEMEDEKKNLPRYGNEAGLSLLNTCEALRTDVQTLKIRAWIRYVDLSFSSSDMS
jgi:hypothetical protein